MASGARQSPLRVVAALARRGDRVLLHRRPALKARGGLWELPGGKVEAGETDAEALQRECEEELGARGEVGASRGDVVHRYPDLAVRVLLYDVVFADPPAEGPSLDGGLIGYFSVARALSLELCEADRTLLSGLNI